MRKILKTAWLWVAGDPRDWAPSNANFLGFAIPALAGLAGSFFKKKSQDKAAQQAYQQQQQQQQWELQQRRAAAEQWNQQRQGDVMNKRNLIKAFLTTKGLNTNPFFENLGGFDAFFSRPVSGLQNLDQLGGGPPIFKPQTSSWWDVGGQALGAAGAGLGQYFGQRQQNNDFLAAAGRMAPQGTSAQDFAQQIRDKYTLSKPPGTN